MTRQHDRRCRSLAWLLALCLLLMPGCGGKDGERAADGALKVCVSSTDVAALVEAVGGEHVQVNGFVKGPDDPHTVNATPSMVRALAEADLLIVVGLGLEEAWLPAMLDQAGNDAARPAGDGHLDLSENMRTIAGPEGRGVPNSFHPKDNPHYLADPAEGVKAALAIADKLAELRPDLAPAFEQNARAFAKRIMTAMVGEELAEQTDASQFEELAIAIETHAFDDFPQFQEDPDRLGGWLGKLRPYTDTPVVGDHDLWPYFARRYGVRMLDYLEPEPGVPPTTAHLQQVIARMKQSDSTLILSLQYFDARHAAFVSRETDAVTLPMAHQPGGRPGTDSYLDIVNYNAEQLLQALEAQAP